MPRKLSRGAFFARQKQDAWDHAQDPVKANLAREAREIRETAQTLLEERGHFNARDWAEHCATRSTDGFWRKVRVEMDRWEQSAPGQFSRH